MIVRDVLKKPELVDNFDWFNDGKDTMLWLLSEIRNLQGVLYGNRDKSEILRGESHAPALED